ncbi:hypothetical protein AA310_01585 [Arthrobacter sp. YC-RL1]|uniref:putative manganese transporter n=1 Tax=Arthrobacter sp. YC-RL1 TaxID=1652545 RepID=UPI00063D9D7D|nr:putative manganese transporter [Arthrobacter sp. YC-RL1]KLI90445.1 hypothetical protein AA310_01585 [Arthrobacter sp. YC-RL1]
MIETILEATADAFLEVGVYVAAMVALFGWARYRWGHLLDSALTRHRKWGPLIGALVAMPPGCGAVLVVGVFVRGGVSYGTAVAALVATMGDASWVLLAHDPLLTLQLKALLFVVGALMGYAVDYFGWKPRLSPAEVAKASDHKGCGCADTPSTLSCAPCSTAQWLDAPAAKSTLERVRIRPLAEISNRLVSLPVMLWIIVGVGLPLSIPVTLNLADPSELAETLQGWDIYIPLGVAGYVAALLIFIRARGKFSTPADPRRSQAQQIIRQGAAEVSFVVVWVGIAYIAWEIAAAAGFDPSALPAFGFVGVLTGALVGLIPGCGISILFAGLFVTGAVPLPSFIANTISQDGDALIPMLAVRPKSGLLAGVITTVPAIVVGSVFLLFA